MLRIKSVLEKIIRRILPPVIVPDMRPDILNNQAVQRMLYFHYQGLKQAVMPLPRFRDTGFRVYSQNDEDGLLLYIFSLIGMTDRRCVDIAFGSPYGANTTNLICNWGFTGLLVEGEGIDNVRSFFERHNDTAVFPPQAIQAWVTAENVNQILIDNGIEGAIDLFSLDIDGVDYWLWNAVSVIQPRVVVVEYQDILGPERAVTVPYKSDFNRFDVHPDFCGASLLAFVKLGKTKGYRLVGVNKYGFNAFFVRNGIGTDVLPEISIAECYSHPKVIQGMKERLPAVENMPWQEV